ncbi:MAG: 1-(5-phosphoribosyl)-5-[(5-phosphoribosylamino)methylideneamino]imidazole-4-carboxamide isomerase [Anaerolineae bacterium]|nr:1-(5-phosphoribosyl)-5-[(5-phosphoribosylamino)methylideneamino]imidazole-4-carboxamide isomerase [Anaerolineae bacterium]MDW8300509.1 1-(5-phosphoribosyl)-5-[(5-phosphoribosylamino)methylideneamino]imidazole-4-carboxamide isomerase [Anaerolineae bacterium]
MIIYPALDLRGGKVVRLRQGDPRQQTVYSDDPLAVAQRWIEAGATWLHVVNLDGAFAEANDNEAILEALALADVQIQFGGGLRTLEDVQRAFDKGAARVVLGTLAVEHPQHVAAMVARWGAEAIAVALDARDGQVVTHGWQRETGISAIELGKQLAAQGVRYAVYTDVSRDGELIGVNIEATSHLARQTGLRVIASGGVTALGEIVALRDAGNIDGVILGTALYEGLIDLAEAIRLAQAAE